VSTLHAATSIEQPIQEFVDAHRTQLPTPYYLLDESRLLRNLEKIAWLRDHSGAKSVLALKCFSSWAVFPLMRQYLDGTTSSSLYEARLGAEKMGKEVHAYSVAFSDEDIAALRPHATKIIFNSVSQLTRYAAQFKHIPVGLRINPGVSHSHFELADPACANSRLGVTDLHDVQGVLDQISGAMFHCQCENADLAKFSAILDHISRQYAPVLEKLEWVSLGGGIYFTQDGYPIETFAKKLADFSEKFDVQVYLEPGETAITQSGFFVTRVLDIVHNGADIAIVDGAVETHMLDLLIYRTHAKIEAPKTNGFTYTVAGRTCLAGDVFGTYTFPEKLQIGSLIPFSDAAGYTLVKKNWFNGIPMPAIVVKRLDGKVEIVKQFDYDDYVNQVS
jgi:carboxynorspermidine decarboxylase